MKPMATKRKQKQNDPFIFTKITAAMASVITATILAGNFLSWWATL